MKIVKVSLAMLLIGILAFFGLLMAMTVRKAVDSTQPNAIAGDCEKMTNSEFVKMLASILGLPSAQASETLSDAELFKIQTDMLAERDLKLFVGSDPNAPVICSLLAEVLFDALNGHSDATPEEKIASLVDSGHMKACGPYNSVCSADILAALSVPGLSAAIAEGYSLPEIAAEPIGPGNPPQPEGPPTIAVTAGEAPASPIE